MECQYTYIPDLASLLAPSNNPPGFPNIRTSSLCLLALMQTPLLVFLLPISVSWSSCLDCKFSEGRDYAYEIHNTSTAISKEEPSACTVACAS